MHKVISNHSLQCAWQKNVNNIIDTSLSQNRYKHHAVIAYFVLPEDFFVNGSGVGLFAVRT
jgi:hypothetical protein